MTFQEIKLPTIERDGAVLHGRIRKVARKGFEVFQAWVYEGTDTEILNVHEVMECVHLRTLVRVLQQGGFFKKA